MAKTKPWHYNGGTITPTAFGSFRAYIRRNGTTVRECHKTLAAAKAWLDALSNDAPILTPARTRDALAAIDLLPEGVTLREAAEFYVANKTAALPEATFALAVELYLDQRATELRARTLQGYRQVLTRAVEDLPEPLRLHSSQCLAAYFQNIPSAHARNRAIRALSAFYSWTLSTGTMTGANPCENARLAKVAEPSRAVLTVEQAAHLLRSVEATDARALPYFAICLFAGLRPEECIRLRAEDVGVEYIRLTGAITKTSSARTVAIRPNLRAILDAHPIAGNICHGLSADRFRKVVQACIKASGIPWTPDIMRHSFASYEYERTRDASATAAEMGHRGVDVFFKHYRGLVPPGSGAHYFAIFLPTTAQVIDFSSIPSHS